MLWCRVHILLVSNRPNWRPDRAILQSSRRTLLARYRIHDIELVLFRFTQGDCRHRRATQQPRGLDVASRFREHRGWRGTRHRVLDWARIDQSDFSTLHGASRHRGKPLAFHDILRFERKHVCSRTIQGELRGILQDHVKKQTVLDRHDSGLRVLHHRALDANWSVILHQLRDPGAELPANCWRVCHWHPCWTVLESEVYQEVATQSHCNHDFLLHGGHVHCHFYYGKKFHDRGIPVWFFRLRARELGRCHCSHHGRCD